MNNYMKTIISGLKQWVSSQKSDWNQNDSSAANFIKNRPFYSEEKERVLFSKTIIVLDTGDEIPYVELGSQLSLIVGRRYEVTVNSVKYSCVAYEDSDWHAICIGNGELVGAPNGNGEPFLIDTYDNGEGYFNAVAGTYNVSISSTVEVVHQIDSKYVPMPELADVAHSGNYHDLIDTPTIPWDIVRYASSQSLTDGNKKIARNNIGASSATNLENGLSSNSLRSTTSDENIGSYAVALGYGVEASSDYSFAEGRNTRACGVAAHAEGDDTVASGQMSHAEGWRTLAFNSYTHAEGRDGAAFGVGSHVEGEGSRSSLFIVSGAANTVEYTTNTTDTSSFLWGKFTYGNKVFTIVNTSGSKIILDKTMSSTSDISNALISVYNHYANGLDSHAEGVGTIADSKMQHVQGQYNIVDSDDKYAHIVGNGLTNKNRSNAHTLDWNGVGWFAGGLKVGGTSQDDAAAVEVALKSDLESIKITADSALSSTSTNPVQNKVVNTAITNLNTLVGDTAVSTQIANAIATKADKTELPQIATAASSDGVAFTVTVPGITALTAGMSFVMIPSRASASTTPTLNVNGLGAKNLRRRLSSGATVVAGYTTTWITKNKPYRVMYDGSAWVVEGHNKPVAADLYGSVLPKVASATLTAANWTGTESPYSQTVVISGTTANSKIDLQPTVAQIVELQTAGTALMTENNSGTITVYAIGEKPTSDYTIQVTITETTT